MTRRFVPLVLASAATFGSVVTPPANAVGANAFLMFGTAWISPGLTHVPTPQSVDLVGTATSVGTRGLVQIDWCSFSGYESSGSIAAGVGTLSGYCGPIGYVNLAYARVGFTSPPPPPLSAVVRAVGTGSAHSGPTR